MKSICLIISCETSTESDGLGVEIVVDALFDSDSDPCSNSMLSESDNSYLKVRNDFV